MNNITDNAPPPELDIRPAGDADIAQVCKILGSAFTNDPVLNWISGEPKIYADLFRSEAEPLYKRHNHVYINREQTGAAMWLPPGITTKAPFHWRSLKALWQLATTGGIKRLPRLEKLEKLMAKHHLQEPHFYLHAVGASMGNQGRGIGSALLKAGLHACDQQGVAAYLESSNIKNNPLYERYGFEIIGEAALPDDGPTFWFMRREARLNT